MPTRSRLRDPWRWLALMPMLGGMGSAVYLIDRRRWRAGLALGGLSLLTLVAVVITGSVDHHDRAAGGTFGGLSLLGYVVSLVLAWALPAVSETSEGSALRVRRPWPAVTEPARRFRVRYGLIAYVVTFAGVIAVSLLLRASGAHLGVGAGVLVVDAILLGSLVPLKLRGHVNRADLGLRATRAGAGTTLAVAALIVYLVFTTIWALLVIHTHGSHSSVQHQFGIYHDPGTLTVAVDCFAIAVSAPVCEEIFFRGLLYRCLRNRLPVWAAALIAGCLFGLVHITSYPLDTIPIKMFFGVLMCLLYERTGSLVPTIAVHAFVDGSSADIIFTGTPWIAFAASGAAFLAVLVRVLINAHRDERTLAAVAAGSVAVPPHVEPRVVPGSSANVPW